MTEDGDSLPVSSVFRGLDMAHIKERGEEAGRRCRKSVCPAVCPHVWWSGPVRGL